MTGYHILFIFIYIFIISLTFFLPSSINAQSANSLYFYPNTISLNPDGQLTLKANIGSHYTNFVGVKMKIDITKVKLVSIIYPLVNSGQLYLAIPASSVTNINCTPIEGDSTTINCKDGVIMFALAYYPDTGNNFQTDIFDVAQLNLTSNNNGALSTSQLTFEPINNEVINYYGHTNPSDDSSPIIGLTPPDNGQGLPITTTPLTFNVYPKPTPTPTPILGDLNNDKTVNHNDYVIMLDKITNKVYLSIADFNHDYKLNIYDYNAFIKFYH